MTVAIRFRPTKGQVQQQQAAARSSSQLCRGGVSLRDLHASLVDFFHHPPTAVAWNVQETGLNASSVLGSTFQVTEVDATRQIPGRNSFAMDAVFEGFEDTWTVYNHMVRPIVLSAAHGQHGTVFAYGQTGSGR